MKMIRLFSFLIVMPLFCNPQEARVVTFNHALRWTDEAKFPNYFTIPALRDSVFNDCRHELMQYLRADDIQFPEEINYKIISGFGKLKTDMPKESSGDGVQVGIFSMITRGTSDMGIYWHVNVVIQKEGKTIVENGAKHELEYFNVSGYLTSQLWLSAPEFRELFNRLMREALGIIPSSGEKIVLGSIEAKEEKIRSGFPGSSRYILKLNGAWREAENFAGILQYDNDSSLTFNYSRGLDFQLTKPSLSPFFASLFTDITGIDAEYSQKVINRKAGRLKFKDDQDLKISLEWIEEVTRSVRDEAYEVQINQPLVARLFEDMTEAGFFIYSLSNKVHETEKTEEEFSLFSGYYTKNSLGIERIHRIEGSMNEIPLAAEMNEAEGIIVIESGIDLLGVMVLQNCNPENRSVGNESLSRNKRFITSSSQSVFKPSMKNEKSIEWYPVYLKENATGEIKKMCIETLVCLFFGMGNM